ncbi:MAG: ABC transporter ATP-binding protein [Bacteroidales bacterium]|nr:ABC transporter ATP-binding protein [Bacteroidales bacterium]MCF8387418.1 ABC transporter ATP-binding protein [Bacteroidales bacterium]MCF8399166.1 ABC transporter ATP-binding protein [Bacteroidales bacterium]
MENNIAVKVNGLTKIYRLFNTPKDRLKESLHPFRKKYHKDFYALRDVNFEINKGDTLAIIGRNGSGKSTLLKILSNVLTPTSGNCTVNGKVSSLLELGTGFNPELSGIENVYFNGTILGFTKEEMDAKVDDILSFADIGEFVDQPVKNYSSGMYLRLAFSVVTQLDPDILIIDEALSVGDMFFQAKCMTRMKKMIENEGTTLLFVSHDMDAVKSICTKAILLHKGQILMEGSSADVAQKYFEQKVSSEQETLENGIDDTNTDTETSKPKEKPFDGFLTPSESFMKTSSFQRIMNGKAKFINVVLLDELENEINSVKYGQTVILRMVLKSLTDIHILGYGYHIRNKNGIDVIYGSSSIENARLNDLKTGEIYVLDWKFSLKMLQGDYSIACVASIPINAEIGKVDFCDFIPVSCQFKMERRYPVPTYGLVYLENEVHIRKAED